MSTFSAHHCAIMLADLSGSSALFLKQGNMAATHQINQQLAWLKQTVATGHGRIVKTLGDGFLAVFEKAVRASETALEIQKNWHNIGDANQALDLKIALTWGEVIDIDHDCYGDAINLAARILALTSAHESLASSEFLAQLPSHAQSQFRRLDELYLRGRPAPVTVWQMCDADFSDTIPVDALASSSRHPRSIRLEVGAKSYVFQHSDTPISVGRGSDADLRMDAAHVSRLHAHIDWHQGQFVLIDRSLNGTCLSFDPDQNKSDQTLRRAMCTLHGMGTIHLAPTNAQHTEQAQTPSSIRFEIDH